MGTTVTPPLGPRKVWPIPHTHTGSAASPALSYRATGSLLTSTIFFLLPDGRTSQGKERGQASGRPETGQGLCKQSSLAVVGTQSSSEQLNWAVAPTHRGREAGRREVGLEPVGPGGRP